LPDGFKDKMAHAMVLLAYVVDNGERPNQDVPIRVSAKTISDSLKRDYIVTVEEIPKSDSARRN
jgi:hypothetical protein